MEHFIVRGHYSFANDPVRRYFSDIARVQPETLGQFTGLIDKSGVKIFEGDVVKYYQPYAKRWDVRKVIFDTQFACFGTALKDQHTFDECD